MPSSKRRSAVLVDQHPLWLDALHSLVERLDVAVVGRTLSAAEALRLVQKHAPDILVAGLQTADDDLDGLALVARAGEVQPELLTVVISPYEDPAYIEAAFAAGAVAYVASTAHPDDIAAAIRQAFVHTLFLAGRQPARDALASSNGADPRLTRRESEVLRLVAEGKSNAEVARSLWVTEQTVKFHLSNVYRKLEVSNRTEASRWAQRNGLLEGPARPLGAASR